MSQYQVLSFPFLTFSFKYRQIVTIRLDEFPVVQKQILLVCACCFARTEDLIAVCILFVSPHTRFFLWNTDRHHPLFVNRKENVSICLYQQKHQEEQVVECVACGAEDTSNHHVGLRCPQRHCICDNDLHPRQNDCDMLHTICSSKGCFLCVLVVSMIHVGQFRRWKCASFQTSSLQNAL